MLAQLPRQERGAALPLGKLTAPKGISAKVAKVSEVLGCASIVITLDLYGSAVEGLMD
jgi:hypothetical protein